MKNNVAVFFGLLMLVVMPAQAGDCGQPPIEPPLVPSGASANASDIRKARDDVLAYSDKVDAFITCMERRGAAVAPYMTKEQIARRQEDLNELHNGRRDLQIALNEAIRAFRRQAGNS